MSKGYPNEAYYHHQQPPVTSQPYMQSSTVVVTTGHGQPMIRQKRPWSSELFSCFDDMTVCLLTWFCEPCFVCYLGTKMGEHCCMGWCVPQPILPMRSAMRERHGIEGSICDDCVCSTFCGPCVVCQLARELKATGEWH